ARLALASIAAPPGRRDRCWRGPNLPADGSPEAAISAQRGDQQPDLVRTQDADLVRVAPGTELAVHEAVSPAFRGRHHLGGGAAVLGDLRYDIEACPADLDASPVARGVRRRGI